MEVQGQLPHGFVREMAFLKAGEECLQILKTLGKIRPFNLFDIPKEEERIRSLFRPEVYSQMDQFFHLRSKIEARDPIENYMNIYAPGYQPEEYRASLQRVTDVQDTLNFYLNVGDGINRAFRELIRFIDRLEEAEHFDEEHLLPIAKEELSGKIRNSYTSVSDDGIS